MTVSVALSRYIRHHEDSGSSPETVRIVRRRVGRLIKTVGDKPIREVSKSDIARHFQGMQDQGLADGTLAGHKTTLKAFFRWCKKKKLINKNPAKVLNSRRFRYSFKPVKSRPAPPDDFQRVIDCLHQYAAHRGYKKPDVRNALIVSLAIDSAARRGEIRNIRRADMASEVSVNRDIYHVLSRGKTGAVRVRFFEDTAALARLWLPMLDDSAVWLFENPRGERLQADYMSNCFRPVCKFAGVKTFRFQAIRKRGVIDIIHLTGDQRVGQKFANHKDIKTTQQHYNLFEDEAVDDAAARLARDRRGDDGLVDDFFKKKK